MINKLLTNLKEIDKNMIVLINKGIFFSLLVCIASIIILFLYNTYFHIPDLYNVGLLLFKNGLMFAVASLVCGFAIDIIKKQMV